MRNYIIVQSLGMTVVEPSTPGGGGGVLLGILSGGVPPGSSNPDPISDPQM